MNFEVSILSFFHDLAGRSGMLDWLVVFIGQYLPYLMFLAVIWFILRAPEWKGRFYRFAFLALAAILSRGLITETIRFFYDRPRPFAAMEFTPLIDHAASAAFPSGHAAFYFALAFAILYCHGHSYGYGLKNPGWWLTVAALLVGVARIVAGVHWPLDILAGMLVALLSVFVVKWVLPTKEASN